MSTMHNRGKLWLKRDLDLKGRLVLGSEKKTNGAYKQNDGKYLIPKDLYKCDKELASILYDISQCDELFIPKGSAQGGRVKAGTRSIHAFGGQRIKG